MRADVVDGFVGVAILGADDIRKLREVYTVGGIVQKALVPVFVLCGSKVSICVIRICLHRLDRQRYIIEICVVAVVIITDKNRG